MHMSLFPEVKKVLATTGDLLPNLLNLLVYNRNKPIILQCAKLAASMALLHENKSALASSGCMHSLFDLILGGHVDVDEKIQYATLQALLNTTHESDSNRMLSVELAGIKPLLTFLKVSSHEPSLILDVQIMSNIAFNNGYTSNCILLAGGDSFLSTF